MALSFFHTPAWCFSILNYENHNFLNRNSGIFSCSSVTMIFTYNHGKTQCQLSFKCLLPSFPCSLQVVCLPACVGTRAEGIWLSFWQLTPSWCCAVLQATGGPGTTGYETPVGQTEWQCQKRKQESYLDSAFFLLPIIENQTCTWKAT